MFGELFSKVVPARSTSGRLAYNDDGNGGGNFKITYTLKAGETVYLRVRGAEWTNSASIPFEFQKALDDVIVL